MNERDKELAKQAGFWQEHTNTWMCTGEAIKNFADLIRADEREACAKVCEPSEEHRRDVGWGYLGGKEGVELLDAKAAAIRARGNT